MIELSKEQTAAVNNFRPTQEFMDRRMMSSTAPPLHADVVTRYKRHHALVSACPGSGKTRVIVERFAELVRRGVPVGNIILCTFTIASAAEMGARLVKNKIENARCGTIHGLALSIIRRHGEVLWYADYSKIKVRDDAELLIMAYSTIRALVYNPETLRPNNVVKAMYGTLKVKAHLDEYERCGVKLRSTLRAQNAVSYRQLVPLAERVLHDSPNIKPLGINMKQAHVLVDEAQDLSGDQWDFLKALEALGATMFLVGDMDQSIYAWRGAEPARMLRYSERDDVTTYTLSGNYRSCKEICEVASKLINHNKERIAGTSIRSMQDDMQGRVSLSIFENVNPEAWHWTSLIANLELPGDCAVLAPTHARLDAVELWLRAQNIPCYRTARKDMDDAMMDELRLLRLGVHTDDDFLCRGCVNWPEERISEQDLRKAEAAAKGHNWSLLQELSQRDDVAGQWAKWVMGDENDRSTIYPHGLENSGAFDEMFRRWAIGRKEAGQSTSLEDFVHDYEASALDTNSMVRQGGGRGVALSTIHGAKGLEWPIVIVLGLEEGTMPRGGGEISEEQRRLVYVAITRAMRELHLSSVRYVEQFGKTRKTERSRFLAEMEIVTKEIVV